MGRAPMRYRKAGRNTEAARPRRAWPAVRRPQRPDARRSSRNARFGAWCTASPTARRARLLEQRAIARRRPAAECGITGFAAGLATAKKLVNLQGFYLDYSASEWKIRSAWGNSVCAPAFGSRASAIRPVDPAGAIAA